MHQFEIRNWLFVVAVVVVVIITSLLTTVNQRHTIIYELSRPHECVVFQLNVLLFFLSIFVSLSITWIYSFGFKQVLK